MVAAFGVQLSTHEFGLHFCPFFPPFSRGKAGFFALLLLPDGPETRGVRRFLGSPKHGEKRVCCEKLVRNAGGIRASNLLLFYFFLCGLFVCLLFPHLVLMFVVLCRGGPLEKEAAEAGAEGSLKKHKKKKKKYQKKKNKKSLPFSRFPLFFFSFFVFDVHKANKTKQQEQQQQEQQQQQQQPPQKQNNTRTA